MGSLYGDFKHFDLAIKYIEAAVKYATTRHDKQLLFQAYAAYNFSKCLAVETDDNNHENALKEIEKWLMKSECYNKIWEELKQGIDKVTWSDQSYITFI